jgi:polar amino acid transport system permease protein
MDLSSLDFSALWEYRATFAWGLVTTIWMGALAFALAVPLGILLALGRMRPGWAGWVLRVPIIAIVDVIRFTPLLVQAVWIHFAFPAVVQGLGGALGIGALDRFSTSATLSGLVALTLHVSAYVSEIMRAGILAVPDGQREAARAMGLRPRQAFRLVVLPQVWPLVLPPLANTAVATFKLTAILSILAIDDLMKVANRINTFAFRPLEIFTVVALIYLLLGLVLAWGAARIERRFGATRLRTVPTPGRTALGA